MKRDVDSKKLSIKDRLKDKRERAKLELILYGVFFLAIIIFARVFSSVNSSNPNLVKDSSFIDSIADNYEYDINIVIDDNSYRYYGKRLFNNMTINRSVNNIYDYFYKMGNKYYMLDNNGNFILTSMDNIYSYIDYSYLDISNIKEYIKLGTMNNNVYNVKVSSIVLNSNNDNYVVITVNEDDKSIVIDYTELFKIDNSDLDKEIVSIKFSNVNKINSLDE